MSSEAHNRAQRRYDKANTRQFNLKLNVHTDEDVIKRLEACGNMQGYVKSLIRADIERGENATQR